jgi:hypothetical protein
MSVDEAAHAQSTHEAPRLVVLPGAQRPLERSASQDVVRAEGILLGLLDEIGPRLVSAAGHGPVERKDDGTPVTPHDRATDALIIETVLAVTSRVVISWIRPGRPERRRRSSS